MRNLSNPPEFRHKCCTPSKNKEPLNKSIMGRVYTKNAQMQGARRRSYWNTKPRSATPQMGIFRANPEGRGWAGGLLCRAAWHRRMTTTCAALRASHPAKLLRGPCGTYSEVP